MQLAKPPHDDDGKDDDDKGGHEDDKGGHEDGDYTNNDDGGDGTVAMDLGPCAAQKQNCNSPNNDDDKDSDDMMKAIISRLMITILMWVMTS